MEITVILSQENETLPKAELLARLGTLKIVYDIINEYPGVIELDVCADKEKIIELGSHLGYTHKILLTLDKTTPEELEDVINHPNIMNLGYINYMDDLYDLIDLAIITDDGLTLHETLACQIPVVVVLGVKYGRYHGLSKVFDGAVIESNVDNISEKVNYALENYDQMYNSTKIYSEDIINATDDLTNFLITHLSK